MKKYDLNAKGKETVEEFVQNIVFEEKTHGKEWAFGALTFCCRCRNCNSGRSCRNKTTLRIIIGTYSTWLGYARRKGVNHNLSDINTLVLIYKKLMVAPISF